MDFFELFKTLGTVATITGAIVWLAKGLITHSFDRDLERYKSDLTHDLEQHKANLKSETDKQVEQFKAELERHNFERQIVFGRLHERRAEVIAKLYSLVWPIAYDGQRVPYLAVHGDTENVNSVTGQWTDLVAHWKENRIYFSEKLCDMMDKFISAVGHTLQVGHGLQMRRGESHDPEEDRESEESLWDDLRLNNEQTFELLRAIESEFRMLVGTTTKDSPLLNTRPIPGPGLSR